MIRVRGGSSKRADRPLRVGVLVAVALAGLVAAPVPLAQAHDPLSAETVCGPSHPSDVREILRLRDPGAPRSGFDDERSLALDRALIIDDFLRLKWTKNAGLDDAVRDIDDALLRRLRDSGRATPEVCAVVRFMHGYYEKGKRPPGRMPDVASAPPVVQDRDAPVVATPRPASAARAMRELEQQRQSQARERRRAQARAGAASTPRAADPSAEPERAPDEPPAVDVAAVDLAQRERRRAQEAILRSSARTVITELQQQLAVPRYLSFRESRTRTPALASDEFETRQEASLRATERLVVLLVRLASEPALRDAVQTALGTGGRARIEQDIHRSFRSVPDAAQRERALRLWSELEAAANVKR